MQIFTCLLLGFLLVCAVSVSLSKNLLNSILIYMSYSLVMSILWILLESPDLAITEAAVGAGVTSVLFFVTLKKIHAIVKEDEEDAENIVSESGANVKREAAETGITPETQYAAEAGAAGSPGAQERGAAAHDAVESCAAAEIGKEAKADEQKADESGI